MLTAAVGARVIVQPAVLWTTAPAMGTTTSSSLGLTNFRLQVPLVTVVSVKPRLSVHGPAPSLKVGFGLMVNLTPLLGVFPPAFEVVQVTMMAPAANAVLVLVPATTVLGGTMWGLVTSGAAVAVAAPKVSPTKPNAARAIAAFRIRPMTSPLNGV